MFTLVAFRFGFVPGKFDVTHIANIIILYYFPILLSTVEYAR